MKGNDRAILAAMAGVVLQTATVAWAGARNAARGSMLHRDGAVARLAVRDHTVHLDVIEAEQAQHVTLEVRGDRLAAHCTCESCPCDHAVAALLELQRRVKQARESSDSQANVLSVLRERLGGARQDAQPAHARILSNLERLPIEAGVDMVALAWRQSLRQGPIEQRELDQILARLEAQAARHPVQTRELALLLLLAVGARKVVFVPLTEDAETAAIRLVPLIVGPGTQDAASASAVPPAETLAALVDLATEGHLQVAAHLAAGLEAAAHRSPLLAAALQAEALQHLRVSVGVWREVASPTGRDRLFSALVVARTGQGDLEGALDLARAWPPMRQALQILGAALGQAGRHDEVVRLAGNYDPRGESWAALVQAAAAAALDAGHVAAAARLATWAFELQPGQEWFDLLRRVSPPALWPDRRAALVARALVEDDPPWLADRLADEPDAAEALLHAVTTAPLRERTVRAALAALRERDPGAAFHGACARFAALVASPGVTARTYKDELTRLEQIANDLKEPGLLTDYARLLGRECGDKAALVTALAAAVGRG